MNYPWKRAIVVGASSGIGAAIAGRLARDGCRTALVARSGDRLQALASELNEGAGAPIALCYIHDVTRFDETPQLFQQICRDLGGLDLVVYSAGVMPAVMEQEYSFQKDRAMIEVNLLGAISWINEAAQRLQHAGEGTIVGISSVAGDRGRRGNPVYAASKSGLNIYLEAIRQRMRGTRVAIVTAKPGPVDTPMTQGVAGMPLMILADEAAARILAAARSRAPVAYIPPIWRPLMFIVRRLPSALVPR